MPNWLKCFPDYGETHDLQRQQGRVRQLHDHQAQPQDHRLLHRPHCRRVSCVLSRDYWDIGGVCCNVFLILQSVHNPFPILLSDAQRSGVPLWSELLLHLHLERPQHDGQGRGLLPHQQHEGDYHSSLSSSPEMGLIIWFAILGCVQGGW